MLFTDLSLVQHKGLYQYYGYILQGIEILSSRLSALKAQVQTEKKDSYYSTTNRQMY
jgi:hypothetical protein